MKTLLTESNLLASLTASQLADIRKQAPAGEDPVADNMLSAAALVDGYCQGREVPANLMTRWARDIAVCDLVKLLHKTTDDQRTAYDAALKALQEVRDGTFPFPSSCGKKSGAIAYGSNRKII